MPRRSTDPAPTDVDARILDIVCRLSGDPANLSLHQQLRDLALRRKFDGRRRAGQLRKLWPQPSDPVKRLVLACRLWAMDPGDVDLMARVFNAVNACAASLPSVDFRPLTQWSLRIAQAAGGFEHTGWLR